MPRIAEGDAVAYRTLVDRHTDRLLAFAERLVGDSAIAEDVVQDAFLAEWRPAARWSPAAKVSTWTYRISRHHQIARLRRRRPPVDTDTGTLLAPRAAPAT